MCDFDRDGRVDKAEFWRYFVIDLLGQKLPYLPEQTLVERVFTIYKMVNFTAAAAPLPMSLFETVITSFVSTCA